MDNFLSETMEAGRHWDEIFKESKKKKKLSTKNSILSKTILQNEEIKTF